MNLAIIVWGYLRDRPLNTVLNIFLLALGISVMTVLLLFNNQMEEKIRSNAKGIDLVVGAKGSPLQLILCSIFHVDFPTGNIKVADAEKVARHRLVKKAIPLALGDSFQGYRIVGTSRAYCDLYDADLASGAWWNNNLDVTLGANVAEYLRMKTGDQFTSAHGLSDGASGHEAHRYVVKGILEKKNAVIDNLILTNVESLWIVHDLADSINRPPIQPSIVVPSVEAGDSIKEVTSLLVQFRNPLAVIQLPRFVNSLSNLQAASPAFETARLFSILGVGVEVLRGFAYLLLFISGLSIFIALYNSLKERKYDLAIMRAMGAGRSRLFITMVMEGIALTCLGCVAGIALGHMVLFVFTSLVPESSKAGISAAAVYPSEFLLLAGGLVLGVLCSLVPAIQAYRTDIHKVLAGG